MAKELAKTGAREMDLIYVAAGSRGAGCGRGAGPGPGPEDRRQVNAFLIDSKWIHVTR